MVHQVYAWGVIMLDSSYVNGMCHCLSAHDKFDKCVMLDTAVASLVSLLDARSNGLFYNITRLYNNKYKTQT